METLSATEVKQAFGAALDAAQRGPRSACSEPVPSLPRLPPLETTGRQVAI